MSAISVRVESRIPAVLKALERGVGLVVAKAALDIEAHAKARAPVDTGMLRNSIGARMVGPAAWVVESPASYSQHVEYGTSRVAARPFLHPAVEVVRPVFVRALKQLAKGL